MSHDHRPKVIFLCSHNSARSQMAEALLRHHAGDRFRVYSAGLGVKAIKPSVYDVMLETGISLDGHYSKTLSEIAQEGPFDISIVVCSVGESQCSIGSYTSAETICWRTESPYPDRKPATLSDSEKLEHYRSLRAQLEAHIADWLKDQPDS